MVKQAAFLVCILALRAFAQITVTPPALTFSGSPGGSIPTQTLSVTSASSNIAWSSSVFTTAGGNWLTLINSSGTTPGSLTVSASPANLAPGAYSGVVTVSQLGGSS